MEEFGWTNLAKLLEDAYAEECWEEFCDCITNEEHEKRLKAVIKPGGQK